MTIGELTLRGAYLGSNVSYNVKKMGRPGLSAAERSTSDLRSIRVKLTRKEGLALRGGLSAMHERHIARLAPNGITDNDLQRAATVSSSASNRHSYLGDVITRIVNGHPQTRLDELMPWAYPLIPQLQVVA